jgi:geranylgeranyl reductase family protein
MVNRRQVIVVGSGPSGSSAAFYLARGGVDVLLVDKESWPRDKACGDAQGGVFVTKVYKDMGIYDEALRLRSGGIRGARFSGVKEELATFDNGAEQPGTFLTQRRVIDDLLRRGAINGGADFLENFEVTEIIRERDYAKGVRAIYGGKEVEIRSDIVILANGAHHDLGRPFGIYNDDKDYVFLGARGYFEGVRGLVPGLIEEHYPDEIFYPGGYMWCFVEGEGTANVGVFIPEENLKRGNRRLEDYFTWWRDNTKIGQERLGEARLLGEIKGWRLPTCRKVPDNIYGNGILAVGDAGSHINCYSGAGFEYALQSGYAAARTVIDVLPKGDVSKEVLKAYKDLDASISDPLLKMNTAVRDKLCGDPQTYEEFLSFARSMPNYPHLNQYMAYIAFMTQAKKVDIKAEYGLDLSAMSGGGGH